MRKISLIIASFAFVSSTAFAYTAGTVEFTSVWDPAKKSFTVTSGTNSKGEKMDAKQVAAMEKYLSATKEAIEKDKDGAATLGIGTTIGGLFDSLLGGL